MVDADGGGSLDVEEADEFYKYVGWREVEWGGLDHRRPRPMADVCL